MASVWTAYVRVVAADEEGRKVERPQHHGRVPRNSFALDRFGDVRATIVVDQLPIEKVLQLQDLRKVKGSGLSRTL